MAQLAEIVTESLGCDFRRKPGRRSGGRDRLWADEFLRGKVRSGFDVVAEILRLEEQIAGADLVITGEGRLDGQTLEGKGPAGVAEMARRHGKPVVAMAGSVADDGKLGALFDATISIVDQPCTLEDAMRRGDEFLERASQRSARLLFLGRHL